MCGVGLLEVCGVGDHSSHKQLLRRTHPSCPLGRDHAERRGDRFLDVRVGLTWVAPHLAGERKTGEDEHQTSFSARIANAEGDVQQFRAKLLLDQSWIFAAHFSSLPASGEDHFARTVDWV